MPEIRVHGRTGGDAICSFCRGPIGEAAPLPCPECKALYHPECAQAHGECATLGCTGLRTAASLSRERLAANLQGGQKQGAWARLRERRRESGPTTLADVGLALGGAVVWGAFGYSQGVLHAVSAPGAASVGGAVPLIVAAIWAAILLRLLFSVIMALSGLRMRRD